jgi:hypothetical protein
MVLFAWPARGYTMIYPAMRVGRAPRSRPQENSARAQRRASRVAFWAADLTIPARWEWPTRLIAVCLLCLLCYGGRELHEYWHSTPLLREMVPGGRSDRKRGNGGAAMGAIFPAGIAY